MTDFNKLDETRERAERFKDDVEAAIKSPSFIPEMTSGTYGKPAKPRLIMLADGADVVLRITRALEAQDYRASRIFVATDVAEQLGVEKANDRKFMWKTHGGDPTIWGVPVAIDPNLPRRCVRIETGRPA